MKKLYKKEFKEIFQKAMNVNRQLQMEQDLDGKFSIEHWVSLSPCLIIRNFEIEKYPACDTEYTDFEESWLDYNNISICRIMDASGNIYFDNF
jgi:hypothetical protein